MKKNNVVAIKQEKVTQVFSYEVTMMVHIVADSKETADSQLEANGGIMTKRDVKFLNATALYGEKE
jgi:hypothetical protein